MVLNLVEFILIGASFILGAGVLILILCVILLIVDFSKHDSNDCE